MTLNTGSNIRVVKQRDPTRVVARLASEKQNPEKGQKKEERDVRTKSNGGRGRVKSYRFTVVTPRIKL